MVKERFTVSVISRGAIRGSAKKVTDPYAVVTLLEAGGYCGF